jgi:hypothetical protein
MAVLDLDPYCECENGSGSRSMEKLSKLTNKPGFPSFKKDFEPS